MFWCLKARAIGYNTERLCSKCTETDPQRRDKIVTGDETRVYVCEPPRKFQNKGWVPKGGNPPEIACRCSSQKEVFCIIFFNSNWVVLQKPRRLGEKTAGKFYRDSVLSEVKNFYKKARPPKKNNNNKQNKQKRRELSLCTIIHLLATHISCKSISQINHLISSIS